MSFRIEERLKIAPENALTKGGKAAEQQVRRMDLPRAHARMREWHLAGGSAGDEVGGRPLGRARRATRATRTSGAALASLARAGTGQAPARHVRSLAGQPVEVAIGAIVDASSLIAYCFSPM